VLWSAGIPDDRICILVPGAVYGWMNANEIPDAHNPYIAWTQERAGELRFGSGVSVPQMLDRLCEIGGYCWGVNSGPGVAACGMLFDRMAAGDVCFWKRPGGTVYSSSDSVATFQLCSATPTDEQHREFALDVSHGGEFCPWVEVEGQDSYGRPVSAFARRETAVTTGTDDYFVGDDFDDIVVASEDESPTRRAMDRLAELGETHRQYSWSGPAVPTLRPDQIATIEDVSDGTSHLVRMVGMDHAIGETHRWWTNYRAAGVLGSVGP
jgi:hypothetical protein